MAREVGLRLRQTAVSQGAATESITFGPVKSGRRWRVERIAARDCDSAFTTLRFIIAGHGYDYVEGQQDSPAAGSLYWSSDDFSVFEGEYIRIDFIGTTAGDTLEAFIRGSEIFED